MDPASKPLDRTASFKTDSPKRETPILLLLLATLTIGAYGNLWTAGFIWDDDAYVTQNPTLKDTQGLSDIWLRPGATPQYYPMVHSMFWVEHQLWGIDPRGYHCINIVLHVFNGLLLFRLLNGMGLGRVAFAVTGLFLLHPIQVESVAWVTERKNVLSMFFFLWSAHFLQRWKVITAKGASSNSSWPLHAAFFCFLCALLSKTTSCVLPAAALVVFWWQDGKIDRRYLVGLIPFFVVGIAFGLVTAWMERWRVGAVGEEFSLTIFQRLLVASHAMCFYIWKAVWPYKLTFVYPRWNFETFEQWQLFAPMICLLAISACIALRYHGRRSVPSLMMLYAGLLFPALGFFNVYPMRYSFVADHFAYLATLPLFTMMALLAHNAISSIRRVSSLRHANAGIMICIAVVCVPLTWQQTLMYQNLETLWRTTLARNPDAWMAHHNLGLLLEGEGNDSEAIEHYLTAVELNPHHVNAMNNAGLLLNRAGQYARAEEILRNAIAVKSDSAIAHNNLGISLVRQGRIPDALASFNRAIEISPTYQNAKSNRDAVQAAIEATVVP